MIYFKISSAIDSEVDSTNLLNNLDSTKTRLDRFEILSLNL